MNCNQVKEELELSFGSPLAPELLEHTNSCESCLAYQFELESLTNVLGDDSSFYLTDEEIEKSVLTVEKKLTNSNKKKSSITEIIPIGWLRPLTRIAAVFLIFSVMYSSYLIGLGSSSSDEILISSVNNSIIETTYVALSESSIIDEMDDEMVSILIEDLNSSSFFGAGELLLDDLTDDEMEYLTNNLSVGDML